MEDRGGDKFWSVRVVERLLSAGLAGAWAFWVWDGNARLWLAGLRDTLSSFWARLFDIPKVALDLWRT